MPTRRLIAVLALLATTVACASDAGAGGAIGIATGRSLSTYPENERLPAPRLDGPSLQGEERITSELLDGKVGVVHFWGSWCGPCRREQPVFEAVSRRLHDRGVRFVGVNTRRDQRAAALAFWEEFDVSYPSIYDPDSRLAHRWRVRVMPQTFIVDRRGRIAARIFGAADDERELERVLVAELER